MNEWMVFLATILYSKAILGQGQPRLMNGVLGYDSVLYDYAGAGTT